MALNMQKLSPKSAPLLLPCFKFGGTHAIAGKIAFVQMLKFGFGDFEEASAIQYSRV